MKCSEHCAYGVASSTKRSSLVMLDPANTRSAFIIKAIV